MGNKIRTPYTFHRGFLGQIQRIETSLSRDACPSQLRYGRRPHAFTIKPSLKEIITEII